MSMGAASVPTIRAVRPRPVFAVLSQIVLFAAVPAAFLGSPALLYALGINYAGAGGNPLEKIHIATLLALVALGFSVLPDGRMQFSRLSPSVFFWLISLIGFASGQLLVLGRPLSGLVVTFLTPVLLLYLVGEARPSALRTLRRLLLLLLLANSLVGLVEVATDEALLPRVAGAFEIESDGRALGLVGNPLMAGFLAGIGVLHLVIGGATRGFRRFAPVEILVHGAALLAFGGRLALVATVLLLVAFVLFDTRAFAQRPVGQRVALRGFLVLGLLACGLAGLTAGLADDILGRMVDDGGSASTRWAALTLAAQLPPEALLFGLPPGPRRHAGGLRHAVRDRDHLDRLAGRLWHHHCSGVAGGTGADPPRLPRRGRPRASLHDRLFPHLHQRRAGAGRKIVAAGVDGDPAAHPALGP